VPRRNIVPVDNDEARKTATGHSCETLGVIEETPLRIEYKYYLKTENRR
jgi:hypothetical protein